MISGQFAKPLFESTVIFGNGEEGREQGALFVQSSESGVVSEDLLRLAPDDTTHVLLVTVVGFTLRFDCLVAYRFLAYCGSHFSSPPNMDLVLELSRQAFVQVNGGLPEQGGGRLPDRWRRLEKFRAASSGRGCRPVRASQLQERRARSHRTRCEVTAVSKEVGEASTLCVLEFEVDALGKEWSQR